ncbi:hypothetical protein ACFS5L_22870 [Streptomyces phyllanthi]|uniref:hypothetical protein n=1 Tax=Streptomyces phyllanthi TaxID=1803180 RepID=UPI001883E41F|nr:hypothetical protein [Streptomyces phyllanthi]
MNSLVAVAIGGPRGDGSTSALSAKHRPLTRTAKATSAPVPAGAEVVSTPIPHP